MPTFSELVRAIKFNWIQPDMVPSLTMRSDDPDFIDRLLTANAKFHRLMEDRRKEADEGKVSSLEKVREHLGG
jgi:hypothetical protein